MKTRYPHCSRNLVLAIILELLLLSRAWAATTNSAYIGPDFGNWSDPANWSPPLVPNNGGGQTFDVTIPGLDVVLDIDATVNSFTVRGGPPPVDANIVSTDHNFTSGATSITNDGEIDFFADTLDVTANLGDLADFSGTSLNSGFFYGLNASSGLTATLQFNGAHIVTNFAGFGFFGPGTHRIINENGADALAGFSVNGYADGVPGFFALIDGASFGLTPAFTNMGEVLVSQATLLFQSDLTVVGDLRDPSTIGGGYVNLYSGSINNPATVTIAGTLTNYDSSTKTLRGGRYQIEADVDGISTVQVLGGALFDIVHNDASILLETPGAALLDQTGADALRNLAVNFRLKLDDHNFTTLGSLTTNPEPESLLSVRGSTQLTVTNDLLLMGGTLEISPLSRADLTAPLSNSQVSVRGNLTMAESSTTRFEVSGAGATATVQVAGRAGIAGHLEIFVLPKTKRWIV